MTLDVPGLDELSLEGKRCLVRVDFNVPLDEGGAITDDTRVRAALPTIQAILERGGTPILLSHLGRPKGQVDEKLRLDPVGVRLEQLLGRAVRKLDESKGPAVEAALAEGGADVYLLENVRFNPGETDGDPELARAYAQLGDVFINDAFGSSHRDHASVTGPARLLPSAGGLLLKREVDAFRRVLVDPARPLLAILGGAKVSDKLPVVSNLLPRCDAILIGGGMAYTFLKALGKEVGESLVQEDQLDAVGQNLAAVKEHDCELLLPTDHVTAVRFAADAAPEVSTTIPAGRMGLDIGPRTRELYGQQIARARTVVWNGPMGVFEWEAFRAGTEAVGRAVASSAAYTVVGGGDSVAALALLGLSGDVDHISTGGGASLELLEGRVLPGFAALSTGA